MKSFSFYISIAAVLSFVSISCMAQNKSLNTGALVKFIDSDVVPLYHKSGVFDTYVRMIISGSDTTCFAIIQCGDKSNSKRVFIEKNLIVEAISNLPVLKKDSELDCTFERKYMENKFCTKDGFGVGYYVFNKEVVWFIDLPDEAGRIYPNSYHQIELDFKRLINVMQSLR